GDGQRVPEGPAARAAEEPAADLGGLRSQRLRSGAGLGAGDEGTRTEASPLPAGQAAGGGPPAGVGGTRIRRDREGARPFPRGGGATAPPGDGRAAAGMEPCSEGGMAAWTVTGLRSGSASAWTASSRR